MNDKKLIEMCVTDVCRNSTGYAVLRLRPVEGELPRLKPGQFVNILIDTVKDAFLRRPISVHDVDGDTLVLMVKDAGPGTHQLCNCHEGDRFNLLLPLGRGFSVTPDTLLIGGGVGIAPLLYLGREMVRQGYTPVFLLGARTEADLINLDEYRKLGRVEVCTEDGSLGVKGFVTSHPVLDEGWARCSVCGPMPMMKAVAAIAARNGIECEVSLENKMACGLGACLCCVEDTVRGNECTCTSGPVFNIKELKW